jgi:hypothetical protein
MMMRLKPTPVGGEPTPLAIKVPPSGNDHSSCAALSFDSLVLDETICLDFLEKRLAMRSL